MPPTKNSVPPPTEKKGWLLPRWQVRCLYLIAILFGVSMLGSVFANTTLTVLIFAWFFAAAFGFVFSVVVLVEGIVGLFRGQWEPLLRAILIGLVIGIVGYGSCGFNMIAAGL
ncbi:hypothetical protein EXS62_01540 [Candidatus Kaiserbacteria bacterium]|nr:hypothetical protein [Candidatus Kaiserbacteria bacterium]